MQQINTQEYLNKLGLSSVTATGSYQPTIELAQQLIEQHLKTIPFENLNPFLELGVELDLSSLEHKLLRQERGGYCFELNKIFYHLLVQLGFKAKPLIARVTYNQDLSQLNVGKTHRLSMLQINDQMYIADVGFGLHTPPILIPLEPLGQRVQHPLGTYKISRQGANYQLLSLIHQEWKELYRFEPQAALEVDYDIANWYLTTHQESKFRQELIASRLTANSRFSLHNYQLTQYFKEYGKEVTQLHSPEAVVTTLKSVFEIKVTNSGHLIQHLEQTFPPAQQHAATQQDPDESYQQSSYSSKTNLASTINPCAQ